MTERNVIGGPLEPCGTEPMTGFYRDGCCSTGPEDIGRHTICAVVTGPFLDHQRAIGNEGLIARFGGDEFLILCDTGSDPSRPERLADAILEIVQRAATGAR